MWRPLPLFTVLVACCAALQSLSLWLQGQASLLALGLLLGVALARVMVALLPSRGHRQGGAALLFLGTALVGLAPAPAGAQTPIDLLVLLVAVATLVLLLEGQGPQVKRRWAAGKKTGRGFHLTRPVMEHA